MKILDKYLKASLIIWIGASIEAVGGLLGLWSVVGSARTIILVFESTILMALLANCWAIKGWVYRHSKEKVPRTVAWLMVIALLLCICGDVVNFNLPESYYRHGNVVKHDYLVDSVTFFAPGYLLMLIASCWIAYNAGIRMKVLVTVIDAGALLGVTSYMAIRLANSGDYVATVTALYAVLITMVAAGGLALQIVLSKSPAKAGVRLVAFGFVLAAVADGVIGQFWIFGKGGEGYFPTARYINWIVYIGSQCLVIHLARVLVWHQQSIQQSPK